MAESKAWISKSRLGGLRRIELYGNPGTPEGRSRGGKKATSLFQQNPRLAQKSGFVIRKKIKYPQKCTGLAEFMGIMLGDGGFPGTHQITISFNNETDHEYAQYITKILKRLFSVNCYIHKRKGSKGADVVINSSNLRDFLLKSGLRPGNKVRNQVNVPEWIIGRRQYRIACLRGLMDTDGSLYLHKYNNYAYPKLDFSSCSRPLLEFVFNTLNELNCKARISHKNVLVDSLSAVRRYFKEAGTSNPKFLEKFQNYFYN
ncbi:MAG: LAGLIDADG family homing endonuclease [Candidatus Omnitrophota bacterium]